MPFKLKQTVVVTADGRKLDCIDGLSSSSIESNHNKLGQRGTVTEHPAELSMSIQSLYCLIKMVWGEDVLPFQ